MVVQLAALYKVSGSYKCRTKFGIKNIPCQIPDNQAYVSTSFMLQRKHAKIIPINKGTMTFPTAKINANMEKKNLVIILLYFEKLDISFELPNIKAHNLRAFLHNPHKT